MFGKNFIKVSLLFSLLTISVYPQKEIKKYFEKKKSIAVKANIMILDSENQYIDGVKAEDIKIFEDGVEQKITSFVEKKPVLNLGIVVDNSGSMRPVLDEIIWTASLVAVNLRKDDKAFAVRFVDSKTLEVIQDWTSDSQQLIKNFQNMYVAGGQSAVLDAIYVSAEKLHEKAKENKDERYALILISDVEERASYYDFEDTVKLFNDSDSQLFIMSYANQAPKKKKLATSLSHLLSLETGGTIHTLSEKYNREELKEKIGKIIIELRSNYIIGYTPTNQNMDGLTRKLTVQISDTADGTKRNASIRESYTIPIYKK